MIASLTNRVQYAGTGTVGPFEVPFRFLDAADLLVTVRIVETGEVIELVLNTDYTVTGALRAAGGTLTLTDALTAAELLTIRRMPSLTQDLSIRNQGQFFPADIEDTFDRQTMQIQGLQDELDRALMLPESFYPGGSQPVLPFPEEGKALVWRDDNTLENLLVSNVMSWAAEDAEFGMPVVNHGYAPFDVRRYGIVGDGRASDDLQLRTLLIAKAGESLKLVLQPGMIIATTVGFTFEGDAGAGLDLSCAAAVAPGTGVAMFKYTGAGGAGTFCVRFLGWNNSEVRGITFNGNRLAETALWIDATNETVGPVTTFSKMQRCAIVSPANNGYDLMLGHPVGGNTPQIDTLVFEDCAFYGEPGSGLGITGIKAMCAGNLKNITFRGGQIFYNQIGADFTLGSGTIVFDDVYFYGWDGTTESIVQGGACAMTLRNCKQESGGVLVGCAGSTGAASSLTIEDCYVASNPIDDVIIESQGALFLKNNTFMNNRIAGAVPKIRMMSSVRADAAQATPSGGLVAIGNYFQNADNDATHWPFIDGGSNLIPGIDGATDFYAIRGYPLSVLIVGNKGGPNLSISKSLANSFPTGGLSIASRIESANDAGTAAALTPKTLFMNLKIRDVIGSLNEAGSGTIEWMKKNVDDSIQIGGNAGIGVAVVDSLRYKTSNVATAQVDNSTASLGPVANNGTANITLSPYADFVISDISASGHTAWIIISLSVLYIAYQTGATYSLVIGTAAKTNFSYNAGTSVLTIENKSGTPVTYRISSRKRA